MGKISSYNLLELVYFMTGVRQLHLLERVLCLHLQRRKSFLTSCFPEKKTAFTNASFILKSLVATKILLSQDIKKKNSTKIAYLMSEWKSYQ